MSGRSLRSKMMWVVMLTTATALLLSAASLLVYEVNSFRSEWRRDLATQAEVLAGTVTPALTFDDAKTATQALASMRLRPQIELAAVYDRQGRLFARYEAQGVPDPVFPAQPLQNGSSFKWERQQVFSSIHAEGELVGTVYLRARHELTSRVLDYLGILVAVMLVSLTLAMLLFTRLQRAVTEPILAVAGVATNVMQSGDYSQRVPRRTNDEIGVLVEAFNSMLAHLSAEMKERERAEEALRAADRRKDEFLATLAHELRNPLAPMVTSLQLLKQASARPDVQEKARGIMDRQVRQMTRLVDDLLEVSRITTGKLDLRLEILDLRTVIDAAVEVTEPLLRTLDHTLHYTRLPHPVWVRADMTRLSQVFINLVNNAAKYTPTPGRISIELAEQDASVTVHVRDNGLGIESGMQQAIFDLFVQVDRSLERGSAGLGIGLTLARRLVEMHGGLVRVHSDGPGLGSVFSVTLPMTDPPAAPSTDVAAKNVRERQGQRILLADDNEDFAASLAQLLELHGHHVVVVHDGCSALTSAFEDPPGIALLDVGMPGLNGLEVARRLRADTRTRHLGLVAITGWSQESDRRAVREAGFVRHLVKPVSPQSVLGVIAELSELAKAGVG